MRKGVLLLIVQLGYSDIRRIDHVVIPLACKRESKQL